MADTLFTQLPVAIALTGSEVVPVDQPQAAPGTYTTKRTTTAQIAQLAASASIIVNQQTGTTYAFLTSDRAKLVSFSNASPIAATLPVAGPGTTEANISWFTQVENRGAGAVTLTPTAPATIDGAASLVLVQNQGVVLAVGDDYNWYTQRGTGLTAATAVTSVGLALPSSVFNVTISPITTIGTLTAVFQTQAANGIFAGPTAGAPAIPTFRSIVTADLPDFGTAGTYGDASNIPVVTTDAKGRVTATTVAITPGSIGSVAANSLVGNPTGSPAAATSISLGATLVFTGSALQTGAGTGDITWSANSYATTISAHAVSYGKFQQVEALSVVGNATNALADAAAITAATDGQVLRRSGTSIGFGALSLSTAAAVTGTLPATNGGTGFASYVVGDILFASSTTALSTLAGVATGNALISGGVGTAPSWGKVGLTTHISGTLGVPNGGTGIVTATAYSVICGGTTGTGAFQPLPSIGTSGQVLTSAGAGALPTWQTPLTGAVGSIIQTVPSATSSVALLTVIIPYDNSIPQNTEGTEVLTGAITPTATSSKVRVRVIGFGSTVTTTEVIIAALFRDSGANALNVTVSNQANTGDIKVFSFEFLDTPATTSAITYKLRTGASAGNMNLNTPQSGTKFGGLVTTSMTLEEIKG
ncbi:hypothetical protein OIU35_31540 [Boseaceae bacterium BT-24-1]|nr:hypothetical protein [Boseaceae bacterium BT-24-1]